MFYVTFNFTEFISKLNIYNIQYQQSHHKSKTGKNVKMC